MQTPTKGLDLDIPGDDNWVQNVPSLATHEKPTSLGMHDDPEGGSKEQLKPIKEKV